LNKPILTLEGLTASISTATRKGKVGILCPYTVEEIIDASGFVPFRLIPQRPSLDIADAYLPNNLCSYLRHVVDMIIKGDIKDLECIIMNHSCDASRRVFDILSYYVPGIRSYFLDIPRKWDSDSHEYFHHLLLNFTSFLEEVSGSIITDECLRESVKVYNENRRLLRKLYSLRARVPHLLDSRFMVAIMNENMGRPKGEMNKILDSLLSQIDTTGKDARRGKRVFVSGGLIDPFPMLRFIEEAGGQVVGDDFCFGGRYSSELVEENEEPVRALSKRYLVKVPCGRMERNAERFHYIIDEMKKYEAESLIYVSLKFCDNFLIDYHHFKKILDQEHIPSLFLESEYFSMGKGQLETRIEGFLEMLK